MNLEKRYSKQPDLHYKNFRFFLDDVCERYRNNIVTQMPMASDAGEIKYTQWTYAKLKSDAYAIASFLLDKGLNQDSRIVLISENRPEWCFSYFATLIAGCVLVPLDASLDAFQVADIVKAAGANAIRRIGLLCGLVTVTKST